MDLMLIPQEPARLQDIKRLNNGRLPYKQVDRELIEKTIANDPYGNFCFRDIEDTPISYEQFTRFTNEVVIPGLLPGYFGVYGISGFDGDNAAKANTVMEQLRQEGSHQSAQKLVDDFSSAAHLINTLRLYNEHFVKNGKHGNCNFNAIISLVNGYSSVTNNKADVYSDVEIGIRHNISFGVYEVPAIITKENLLEFLLSYPVVFGQFYFTQWAAFSAMLRGYSLEFFGLFNSMQGLFATTIMLYENVNDIRWNAYLGPAALKEINYRDPIPFDVMQIIERSQKWGKAGQKEPELNIRQMAERLHIATPYFDLVSIELAFPKNIDPVLFTQHSENGCLVALRRWSATGVFAHAIDMITDTVDFLRKYQQRKRDRRFEPLISRYDAGTLFTDYRKLFG